MKLALTIQVGTLSRFEYLKQLIDTFIHIYNPEIYLACHEEDVNHFIKLYPTACVIGTPNLGTDLGKFLFTLKTIKFCEKEYDFIIKIHTKKPCRWSFELTKILDPHYFEKILKHLEDPKVGMMGAYPYIGMLTAKDINYPLIEQLLHMKGFPSPEQYKPRDNQSLGLIKRELSLELQKIENLEKFNTPEKLVNFYMLSGIHFIPPNLKICNDVTSPKFVMGTMFVSRFSFINEFFDDDLIDFIIEQMEYRKEIDYFTDSTRECYTHALERLLGVICCMYGLKLDGFF